MRKGQITLFVILGLALLLIVGLVMMLSRPQGPSSLAAQQEAQLVTSFVQQCLATVGQSSIERVGLQGGYADLSTLKNRPTQDTQVVDFAPQQIPYWHEVHACGSGNSCIGNNRPALCARSPCPIDDVNRNGVSFQASVEQVATAGIDSCLGDFGAFEQLTIRRKGEPRVRTIIREEDVAFTLDYPLEVTTTDNQKVSLEEFATQVPVSLPMMYRMAMQIQQLERQTSFLENQFLNLLAIYQDVDGPLPPLREITISGSRKVWVRANVQRTMEQEVLPMMNFVQVDNAEETYVPVESLGIEEPYQPYANGVYEYMEVHLDDVSYPLGVRFEYPNTPVYLDINGKEFLKPRELPDIGGLLSFLRLNIRDYRFKYNVAFPMVVTITDPAAFDGRGYTLNYALEVNIRNNNPMNLTSGMVSAEFGQSTIDLSDDSQLVNHVYRIKVTDRKDGEPLAGARVVYACDQEYTMGETNALGEWSGRLPYCMGGAIVADLPGYVRASKDQHNTQEDGRSTTVSLKLWPTVTKTVKVYKLTPADVASAGQTRTKLTPNDSVILLLSRVKESEFEDDIPQNPALQFGNTSLEGLITSNFADMQAELDSALEAKNIDQEQYDEIMNEIKSIDLDPGTTGGVVESVEVELAPGRYELDGPLIYSGNITIPDKKVCLLGFLLCRTLQGPSLPSWQSGGVLLVGENATTLRPEDVYGEKNLTLFVLEQPLPKDWDELERYQDIADYQTYERKALVQPRFE